MTIDEAIAHCLEVAEQNDFETRIYDDFNKSGDEEYRNNHCQCATDHRQLAEWLTELKEAKRLLKAAVEDMTGIQFGEECKVCSKKLLPNECPIHNNVACILGKDFKWRYADEALALIGEDTNVPASADDTNVGGKIDSSKDVQPINLLVKVEERVPDVSGNYLCYLATDEFEVLYFDRGIEDDEYNLDYPFGIWNTYPSDDGGECREWIEVLEVTHWQPLPEPPKE